MGGHQRSVKTKSFLGQSYDEKTLYRIHLGISGDAMHENCNCFVENREKIVLLGEWRCIFVRECGSIKDMQRGSKEKY